MQASARSGLEERLAFRVVVVLRLQSWLVAIQRGEQMLQRSRLFFVVVGAIGLFLVSGLAHAATVVALGASNTFGKGVSPGESYPAQLEVMLHAKGINGTVVNAGINGDTTEGMLARLDSAVPKGTSVVILQPGGNDMRKGRPDQTGAILGRLRAMGVTVVMCPNGMFRGLPHQPDGQHLTPEGYHMLAAKLVGQVAGALRR
jgi:acyl-CoA thioesterase I